MAALPQWDLPVVAGDPSPLPWRLIWTWHPVLEAFGHNKSATSSYTADPWFYPTELHDHQKEVYKLLPVEIENYHDYVIVYPLYRLIVFHHTAKPRNKMINLLTSKLALPGDSEYFHSLKTRRPGAPLPTIPGWVNDVCARKLQDALLVLLRQRSPNDKSSWKTYVQANSIMVPDRPVTLEEYNQISTPPAPGDFPTLSETVGRKPSAKAPVAAKKGSLTAQSTIGLRPSVPPRPPQTKTPASSSTSSSLRPPLILKCLLLLFLCLCPLFLVLIRKRRYALSCTTLLQFQSSLRRSPYLPHARQFMNSMLKPLPYCPPSTHSMDFLPKKQNRFMIIFSTRQSPSFRKTKWILPLTLLMFL